MRRPQTYVVDNPSLIRDSGTPVLLCDDTDTFRPAAAASSRGVILARESVFVTSSVSDDDMCGFFDRLWTFGSVVFGNADVDVVKSFFRFTPFPVEAGGAGLGLFGAAAAGASLLIWAWSFFQFPESDFNSIAIPTYLYLSMVYRVGFV